MKNTLYILLTLISLSSCGSYMCEYTEPQAMAISDIQVVPCCAADVDRVQAIGGGIYRLYHTDASGKSRELRSSLPFHIYNYKRNYISILTDGRWTGGVISPDLVYISPTGQKINYNGKTKNLYNIIVIGAKNITRQYTVVLDTDVEPPYINNL